MAARKALTPFRMIQWKAHLHSQGRQAAPKSLRLVRNCLISSLMAQVGFMKGLTIKKTYERLLFIDCHIISSYVQWQGR